MKKENNVTEMEKVNEEMENVLDENVEEFEVCEIDDQYVPVGVAVKSLRHWAGKGIKKAGGKIAKSLLTGAIGTGIAMLIGYTWVKTHEPKEKDIDKTDSNDDIIDISENFEVSDSDVTSNDEQVNVVEF